MDNYGLNWYHYGARFYDLAVARWNQMDPADQFHSPYEYVGNDPVRLVDPTGKQAWSHVPGEMEEIDRTMMETDPDWWSRVLMVQGVLVLGVVLALETPAI